MHQRCRPSTIQRRRLLACLAAAVSLTPSIAVAQAPSPESPLAQPAPSPQGQSIPELAAPAEPAAEGNPSELQLNPPINSTLKMRVARRPWLLEKLSNSRPAPAVKMRPPRPPADIAVPSDDSFSHPAPMIRQRVDSDRSVGESIPPASNQPGDSFVRPLPGQPQVPATRFGPEPTSPRQPRTIQPTPPSAAALQPPDFKDISPAPATSAIEDGWQPRRTLEDAPGGTPTTQTPAAGPRSGPRTPQLRTPDPTTANAKPLAPQTDPAPAATEAHGSVSDERLPQLESIKPDVPATSLPKRFDEPLQAVPLMRDATPKRSDSPARSSRPAESTSPPGTAERGTGDSGRPRPGVTPSAEVPPSAKPSPKPEKTAAEPRSPATANDLRSTESIADRMPTREPTTGGAANEAKRSPETTNSTEQPPPLALQPAEAGGKASKKVTVRELRLDPGGFLRDRDDPERDPDDYEGGLETEAGRPSTESSSSTRSAKAPPSAINRSTSPPSASAESTGSDGASSIGDGDQADEALVEFDYTGYPLEPITLNRTVRGMERSIRACLRYYYARPEVADKRSNWGMLHSIMVYGIDTKIIVGRKQYSAIAWIAGNNPCRGQRLLVEGLDGIEATNGVGLQGHQGQMLAIFGMCGVPRDYPLYAGNNKYAVEDVIRAEMDTCRDDAELTFTLIALSHYLDTDATWTANDGQRWDFERVIRAELAQPIVGSACGGTHRLMGLSHALRKRRAEGKPVTGQWKRAELFLDDFQSYCYRLQNRDGSMSTNWFEGREDSGDLDRKIQTTGHMVEWLLTITPDSQLQNPRLVNAVRFLLASMYNQRTRDWAIGPKGHALRSLAMFYERAYRSGPAWQDPQVAGGQTTRR